MGAELEPRVAGSLRHRDRAGRHAGPQLGEPGLPQPAEHTRRDPREQRRIVIRVRQLERLVRRCHPAFGVRGEDQALGQQREQSGVGRGIGLVGDRDRRLDRVEILRCRGIEPPVVAVRRSAARMSESCAPLRRARSAPCASVSCASGFAGPELRVAEPHEQIGAFGVGAVDRDGHVERDAVVVRRLGRCELFERLVAGERRPPLRRARASRGARQCRASWTTTSGPMCSPPSRVRGPLARASGRAAIPPGRRTAHWRRARARTAAIAAPIRHRPGGRPRSRYRSSRPRPTPAARPCRRARLRRTRCRAPTPRSDARRRARRRSERRREARRYVSSPRSRRLRRHRSSKRPDSTQCRMSCDA